MFDAGFADPLTLGKDSPSWVEDPFAVLTGMGGLCMAESAIYVSMHLASRACQSHGIISCIQSCLHTDYCLLKLSCVMDVEELSSSQRKHHALIVLLQLIVDLGSHKSGKLSVRERLILVEGLTVSVSAAVRLGVNLW